MTSSSATSFKLISLNIESDKHLDAVLPFLEREKADIICFQEILKSNLGLFAAKLGFQYAFAPTAIVDNSEGAADEWGVAIFKKAPLLNLSQEYYSTGARHPGELRQANTKDQDTLQRVLLSVEVETANGPVRVGTTHFTWTPNGQADDLQRRDLIRLFEVLKPYPQILFCGDFNAPRGGEIYSAIAARYRDCLPSGVSSTLDPDFHRVRGLELAVDSIFTSAAIGVTDVRVVSGVSDHRALIAQVRLPGGLS